VPGTAGALRIRTLDRLAGLLSGDRGTPLPDDEEAWTPLLTLAARHWLLPALWVAIRDADRVRALPDGVLAAIDTRVGRGRGAALLTLQRAYNDNVRRNSELLSTAESLLDRLAAEGITAVPLKGIHTMELALWPDAGSRMMGDIDLLVDPDRAHEAFELLRSSGFRESEYPIGEYADHQLPMLESDSGVIVELHTELLVHRWRAVLPASVVWGRVAPRGPSGRLLMDDTHAVVHLVAHGQLQDDTYLLRELPLRALHELAVWARCGTPIDWEEVAGHFDRVGRRSVLDASLLATARMFHAEVPVRAGLSARRQHLLCRAGIRWPLLRRAYRYVLYLPRSFSRARMEAEFGSPRGRCWLWHARARHIVQRVDAAKSARRGRAA